MRGPGSSWSITCIFLMIAKQRSKQGLDRFYNFYYNLITMIWILEWILE